MYKLKKSAVKILAILVFILISSISYSEPRYEVNNLKITAQINENGSVDITEFAQYDAYDINGILYNIDYKGYGELKNLDVFYEENNNFMLAENNNTRRKGTYLINFQDDLANIKLFFPLWKERKWFAFRYTLPEGVTVYKDTAQFNRKMVGRGWQTGIDNVEVRVILPKETDTDKINAFGHGSLTGNVDIVSGKEIVYTLRDYYPGEFVETNILFPKNLVSKINPSLVKNEKAYDKIMEMERELAEQANRKREFAKVKTIFANIAFGGIICWLIFVAVFAYLKNGKKYKVVNEYGEYFRELPNDFTPAVAGSVVSKRVKPQHLLATVMDLVRKDIFEMIEDRGNNQTVLKLSSADTSQLKDYEKFLIEWYINELGDGEQVVMEDIERYISSRKNALAFGRKYEKWEKMVRTDLVKVGFTKEKPKKLPVVFGTMTLFLAIPTCIMLSVYFDDGRFIALPFVSFFIGTFAVTRRRYSLTAEELRSKWNAFKKFLIDYSNLEEAKLASIHIWEHYFVYAIALGVAEKVAKGYQKIFRESDLRNSHIDNYHRRMPLMYMYSMNNGFRNIERTTMHAVSRSNSALANSRRSSSTGRGGGFSGGSSGGGGGRGGGGAF